MDDWLVYRTIGVTSLASQGWKIHASACLGNADAVLDEVFDYCVTRGIAFKFIRSRQLLLRNGKYAERGASGKFVTIYPTGEDHLRCILEELGALLDGQPGPYILCDLRWGSGPLSSCGTGASWAGTAWTPQAASPRPSSSPTAPWCRTCAGPPSACRLAGFTSLQTLAIGAGGQLPLVLILFAALGLVLRGLTAGAILGALTYVLEGIHPALQRLVRQVGGTGLWLAVALGRLLEQGLAGAAPVSEAPAAAEVGAEDRTGVELRGVSFRYGPWSAPVVEGLDLVVPAGTTSRWWAPAAWASPPWPD